MGTGSSGVQVIPAIAERVASLTVYQRTPNWCTPLNNAPITPPSRRACEPTSNRCGRRSTRRSHGFLHQAHDRTTFDDTSEERQAFYETMWASPGFSKLTSNYTDLLMDRAGECGVVRVHRRQGPQPRRRPRHRAKLIPTDHRFGEHRPPFVTSYYETFNRPNVSLVDLVDTPMVRVTETGIETDRRRARVRHHRVGNGLRFRHGRADAMGIRGRDGVALVEHWADGPTTFAGVQTTGFPNFFFPGGPHAAAGNNPRYNGDQVDFVTDTITYACDRGYDVVEVDPEAEARWTAMVDRWAVRPPSFGMSSYYFGTNIPGKPRRYLLNAGGRPKLFSTIADEHASGYRSFRMSSTPSPRA